MRQKVVVALATLSTLAIGSNAEAINYGGNPDLGFQVDRPQGDYIDGSVYLNKIRVHKCDGSYVDYGVYKTVDPVAGYARGIASGDYCGATWYWGSAMVLNGPGYTLKVTDSSTYAPLDPIKNSWFSNWSVDSGDMPGTEGPELWPSVL